nr:phosphatase PAP2 family protein [Azospirillum sp. SYSU D00513]
MREGIWSRLGRHELAILGGALAVAALLSAFVALAGEVLEGETQALDRLLLLALRDAADPSNPLGPSWVEEMARDITALGSMTVLILITLAAVGFLLLMEKRSAPLFLLASVGGGILLSTLLKLGIDRARPDLVPHGQVVYTASFPSGHSMLSAVVYLTLGALLARFVPRRRLKAYVLVIAILLTLMVGMSRVYLGVHWPTDVLAGWTAGAAWALLCWVAAAWLQSRGTVEDDHETVADLGREDEARMP